MSKDFEKLMQPILVSWARLTFTQRVRARLYRKIAAKIGNGVNLMDATNDLYRRSVRRGETETLAIVLADVRQSLGRGEGLSRAFKQWSGPTECMLLAAGEASGRLSFTLNLAADTLTGSKEMYRAVIEGVTYPAMLFVGTIYALYFIGVYFIPQMAGLGDAGNFTETAASVYFFSNFVQTIWFWFAVCALLGIISMIVLSLPRAFGGDGLRVYLDKIPPWSIYRLMVGSGFLVSLSALLMAGLQLKDAVIQIKKNASPYLSIRLEAVLAGIRAGKTFGESLDDAGYQFPDVEIIDDLVTYSNLPNFHQVLFEYGQRWRLEGVETVKKQAEILKAAAFIIVTILVSWLAVGILQIEQQHGSALQQLS